MQEFKVVDNNHIEYNVLVENHKTGYSMEGHAVGKVKDGKLAKIMPFHTAAYEKMFAREGLERA